MHSRLKNAKRQLNKRSLTFSEGEPILLSIHTRKGVEVAASLPLPRTGAKQRLTAWRRAKQVQTGSTWTTDGVYLGNRRKSRGELRQRDNKSDPAGCSALESRREKTEKGGTKA